ncbi:hypothetical protein [Caballeronia sp. SBC2]|uniref:hypothetical protein n=1 Tax=Caballeronia sp. SBC2 TaxID=2705547 RepID=UPI0013E17032|nr:hypothetical protein [Caballeronia sp. SBC2]QIE22937.1 hypothetical protein SBC2_09500 [Caballeronia sp. SBC2]
MQLPTKKALADSKVICFCSGDYSLNPNPRVYKYYWQVFTMESEWEGRDFFANAPELSIAAYLELERKLRREGRQAFVYNTKRLRLGHGLPLDMNHPRWKGSVLAPSLEEDTDPEHEGYK